MPENKPKRTYEEVQAEINSKLKEKKAYQERIQVAIDHIKSDPKRAEKLKTFVDSKLGGSTDHHGYCIGSACYSLQEAKEILSYTSGTKLQDDITSGKLKGYNYDYDLNGVEKGDILQLNKKTEKGGRGAPYHNMLVQKVNKDESGNVKSLTYFGSQGSAESFDYHDIDSLRLNDFKKDKNFQIVKKEFVPNSLYKERDAVKPIVKAAKRNNLDYIPDEQIKYLGSNDESSDKTKNRQDYVNAMMGRKKELMKAYNISNSEYNDLVKVSAGIIDQESEYGTSGRYKAKNIPGVQFVGKLLTGDIKEAFDKGEYSSGPGQSKPKYFPSVAGKKFGITPESKESTLLTVLDRYTTQVPSNLKGTPAAMLKTANVYKGMSNDNNEYAKSVLDKAASFGLSNYDQSKASFNDIKNKERVKKQEVMQQSFAPAVKQENFVNVKKEPVVKFRNGGWLDGLDNNKFQEGGEFGDYKQAGPVEDSQSEYVERAGMTGMMKSKIATEANYGNPSALRMVSPNPNKYTFTGEEKDWKGNQASPAGYYGTHFMSSFGNQARPGLQEVNGKMQYFQNPPRNSKENFNFSRPEDANYFAENYKEVAPMMRGTAPDVTSTTNKVIEDNRGQWAHPGKVTKINSNQITMKGVNYPVLGVSDSGDTQMMKPGGEYNFKGKTVTEYPQKFQPSGLLNNLGNNNPIQDNTRVKTTVIPNQALISKSNLNKNKGTLKSIDRMPEQPLTREEVRKGIKFTTDVAGLFYPPAAIAGSAMDMYSGDKTGALIGLIPGAKDFLTNKNMVTKLATKAFNLGIPNKVVQPSKKVIREAGKYIKGSAEVVEAKDDIGTPIVEAVKSKLRNGGWLDNLSKNKFDMGGVLDGLDGVDKGTQVPDATATAKPVVNLNFAVTPAQKQLAAKNKRQAEIDMQVDHPEFYTNSNFLDKKAVKPYSVEDYKKGIKEPGLQTSMDPIDLVGTGAYKGLAKALGAKEVAVAADAALFNSLDKSKVLYNQVKSKAKDEIYKLKYNKDIASLESKKFNAMQKMNNPEGWKRLREQGIEPKQFFDQLNKSKITSTRDIGSWDNGAQINIDFDQVKKLQKEGYDLSVDNIIDHEIGHRMQRGFNSKAVNDYNQAKSYNYRNQVPKYHVYSTPLDKEAELLLSPVIKNPNGNSDYFLFGSDNKERLPFLREAKESMVSKGFINNIYSKITPETVKKFLKEVPSNRFSTFLDVENPITHRRLSGLLNKTPIVAGAGLGVNELAKDKKQNTGWLDNLK